MLFVVFVELRGLIKITFKINGLFKFIKFANNTSGNRIIKYWNFHMAGSKGDKYYNVFLDFSIWLKSIDDQVIVNEKCLFLLLEIKKLGSIKLAAEKLGFSYRKAWNMIESSESLIGFKLVEKTRGGKDGGHTSLSPEGENLVGAFVELKEEINFTIKKVTKKFFNKINLKPE